MQEKIYFCLLLFSLWSAALYSAHAAAAAEMLMGFECRLPAGFCVAPREAVVPETSRSSGGDLVLRSSSFLPPLQPNAATGNIKRRAKHEQRVIFVRRWRFECLCRLTNLFPSFLLKSSLLQRLQYIYITVNLELLKIMEQIENRHD